MSSRISRRRSPRSLRNARHALEHQLGLVFGHVRSPSRRSRSACSSRRMASTLASSLLEPLLHPAQHREDQAGGLFGHVRSSPSHANVANAGQLENASPLCRFEVPDFRSALSRPRGGSNRQGGPSPADRPLPPGVIRRAPCPPMTNVFAAVARRAAGVRELKRPQAQCAPVGRPLLEPLSRPGLDQRSQSAGRSGSPSVPWAACLTGHAHTTSRRPLRPARLDRQPAGPGSGRDV